MLSFTLKLTPHNSSLVTSNVVVTVSGPFQSEGPGKLPDSDITFSIQAQGEKGKLQLISTGGEGYVEIDGVAYRLPSADIKQVKSGVSSVSGIGASQGQSTGSEFKQLGIDPLGWLAGATVVGHAQVGGAQTTHIHATVNATPMIADLSKLLGKVEQLGINGGSGNEVPSSIPKRLRGQIAHEIGRPTFDVWTGTSDRTVRKLTVTASLPASGSASNTLGGLTSADVYLAFEYEDLNQPQQIQAPTNVKPFTALKKKVSSLVNSIEETVATASLGGGSSTGSGGGVDQKYGKCITAANGNVTKMQACTNLLGG